MKVIKRDGRAVEYDRAKIEIAIEKANNEVYGNKKATKKEIKEIINYIEKLDRKRILVEDIQDIIEQKLMEIRKYELAKKYIVYRYTRALVRKANTTDESILGMIRNGTIENEKGEIISKNITASIQREYIAGEVSKDLTKRMLLPEKIVKAHEEGILYFHDSEYFLQPICRNSFINLEDMLENGTVINNMEIETPKRFETACLTMSQIIENIASNQYGSQEVDCKCLGKYLKKSEDKLKTKELIEEELKQGIEIIKYQLNTLMAIHGRLSCVKIYLHLKEDDPYLEQNKKIQKEFLKQYSNNTEQCCPIIFTKEKENTQPGTFSQGKVSINLSQIANISEGNEKRFWQLLKERLELCYEALMCRHYALKGTISDISPVHWQYGAIARLKKGEKINRLLYDGNSTLSLGYIGMEEMKKIMKSKKDLESEVIKFMKKTVKDWTKQTNITFIVEN